jgi:hypothetical protein
MTQTDYVSRAPQKCGAFHYRAYADAHDILKKAKTGYAKLA